jgi:hypothetical protein
MNMPSKRINNGTSEGDTSLETSLHSLLDVFKAWLHESARINRDIPWSGGHDEGTYLTAWREYYLHTKDPAVMDYARDMLDKADAWAKTSLVNGYRPKSEVHHGVEHYVIFLNWMHEIDPPEPIHARQLLDAAANITAKETGRPPWYDGSRIRFTSTHMGSRDVDLSKDVNIAEHLRIIRLAWLGFASGGDPELKTIIRDYGTKWATQIASSSIVPVYLDEFSETDPARREHNAAMFKRVAESFVGAQPKSITTSTRSEIHVANGTPDLFMALHDATGDAVFLDAAERIVEPVLGQISLPHAHPLGELAWHLHQLGRLPRLDEIVKPIQESVDIMDVSFPLKLVFRKYSISHKKKYANTIGMRKDMPIVEIKSNDDKRLDLPSPATLGLMCRLSHDPKYIQMALELAKEVLILARSSFPEGRSHGCSARMVHSFCVGHGRNWGAGYTSTALRAALNEDCVGIELPRITL